MSVWPKEKPPRQEEAWTRISKTFSTTAPGYSQFPSWLLHSSCCSHAECQERDFNMVCNEESEQCECREATQWNEKWERNHKKRFFQEAKITQNIGLKSSIDL